MQCAGPAGRGGGARPGGDAGKGRGRGGTSAAWTPQSPVQASSNSWRNGHRGWVPREAEEEGYQEWSEEWREGTWSGGWQRQQEWQHADRWPARPWPADPKRQANPKLEEQGYTQRPQAQCPSTGSARPQKRVDDALSPGKRESKVRPHAEPQSPTGPGGTSRWPLTPQFTLEPRQLMSPLSAVPRDRFLSVGSRGVVAIGDDEAAEWEVVVDNTFIAVSIGCPGRSRSLASAPGRLQSGKAGSCSPARSTSREGSSACPSLGSLGDMCGLQDGDDSVNKESTEGSANLASTEDADGSAAIDENDENDEDDSWTGLTAGCLSAHRELADADDILADADHPSMACGYATPPPLPCGDRSSDQETVEAGVEAAVGPVDRDEVRSADGAAGAPSGTLWMEMLVMRRSASSDACASLQQSQPNTEEEEDEEEESEEAKTSTRTEAEQSADSGCSSQVADTDVAAGSRSKGTRKKATRKKEPSAPAASPSADSKTQVVAAAKGAARSTKAAKKAAAKEAVSRKGRADETLQAPKQVDAVALDTAADDAAGVCSSHVGAIVEEAKEPEVGIEEAEDCAHGESPGPAEPPAMPGSLTSAAAKVLRRQRKRAEKAAARAAEKAAAEAAVTATDAPASWGLALGGSVEVCRASPGSAMAIASSSSRVAVAWAGTGRCAAWPDRRPGARRRRRSPREEPATAESAEAASTPPGRGSTPRKGLGSLLSRRLTKEPASIKAAPRLPRVPVLFQDRGGEACRAQSLDVERCPSVPSGRPSAAEADDPCSSRGCSSRRIKNGRLRKGPSVPAQRAYAPNVGTSQDLAAAVAMALVRERVATATAATAVVSTAPPPEKTTRPASPALPPSNAVAGGVVAFGGAGSRR